MSITGLQKDKSGDVKGDPFKVEQVVVDLKLSELDSNNIHKVAATFRQIKEKSCDVHRSSSIVNSYEKAYCEIDSGYHIQ